MGEAFNEPELQEKLSALSGSFVIIPTVRAYLGIPHETDRYKIISIPSAYAQIANHVPELSDDLQNRKIQKHFLSLNNRAQWSRHGLAQFLIQSDLIKHFIFSYHCHDRFGDGRRKIFEITNQCVGSTWFNNQICKEEFWNKLPISLDGFEWVGTAWSFGNPYFYQTSFGSVVCETYIDENWDPYLSEKIFKPLAYGHPFMVHSSAGALRLLQQMGFETFPEIFDESYDDIESPQLRFEHILREIQRICDLSLDDLQNLYRKLIPKLKHNQDVFRKFLPDRYTKDIQRVKSEIKHLIDTKNGTYTT